MTHNISLLPIPDYQHIVHVKTHYFHGMPIDQATIFSCSTLTNILILLNTIRVCSLYS